MVMEAVISTHVPSFSVLGPLTVTLDGSPLAVGGPKQKAVLALLLLSNGNVVALDRISEALWGADTDLDSTRKIVQVYISNLRKALEPLAAHLGLDTLIRTERPGYVIAVPASELDVARFEQLVDAARKRARGNEYEAALMLGEGLALWRGTPLADLVADEPGLQGLTVRLLADRLAAAVDRIELEVGLGRHLEVLTELGTLVDAHPLDERLRGLHMVALYRAGRQAAALESYQHGRRRLVDELGIEPGPDLRELERKVLQQSADLSRPTSGHEPLRDLLTVLGPSVLAARAVLLLDGRRVALDRASTTIGRQTDRHVVLDSSLVSREHAEIRRTGDGFVLVDTGSTNGTRLNGERIQEATLAEGDVVGIGETELSFHLL